MENVSINRARRGRPRKLQGHEYEPFAQFRARTLRAKQNYIYASRAIQLLTDYESQFAYTLFDYLLRPSPRLTTLAELGRFEDSEPAINLAGKICYHRMNNSKAIGLIRRARGKGFHSCLRLSDVIINAIAKYLERYDDVTADEVKESLKDIRQRVDGLFVFKQPLTK